MEEELTEDKKEVEEVVEVSEEKKEEPEEVVEFEGPAKIVTKFEKGEVIEKSRNYYRVYTLFQKDYILSETEYNNVVSILNDSTKRFVQLKEDLVFVGHISRISKVREIL